MIDQRQYERLQAMLADARSKGARVVNLCGAQAGDPARRIMPPQAVVNVSDDMDIMQREIFGCGRGGRFGREASRPSRAHRSKLAWCGRGCRHAFQRKSC